MLLRIMIKQFLLGMVFMASISSCVKPEDGYPTTTNLDYVSSYKVNSYKVNGNDFKSKFDGYQFKFTQANTIVATSSTAPIKEAEYRTSLDSFIVIKFTGNDFQELNKPWVGLSLTTHTMDMNFKDGPDNYAIQFSRD
jgi:hypothetical protein